MLQYLSDACIILACVVFALVAGKRWAWGPFITALLIVAAAAGMNAFMVRAVITASRPDDAQRRRLADRQRRRNSVIYPAYATFGIGLGLIAGSIPSYWPDVALGVLIMLTNVLLPLALLPALKRRIQGSHAGDN